MRRFAVVPLVMVISIAYAAENSNPFVSTLAGSAATLTTSPPLLDDPLPQSFTENRSVFDMLEVVGRGVNFAVLRYPMTGSLTTATTQGISYRELIVRDGKNTFIGGRSFKAVLPHGDTNVLLVNSKNGKVLWEGDLSAPKVYHVNPNITDYQYTPPISAGVGVGQSEGNRGLSLRSADTLQSTRAPGVR